MAITAAMVKELREVSGAGMMDCKKALTATEGDMDKAMEFRWRRAGSSDRYHRREHEHPSFPAGKRGERFRCFLYSYGR